MNPALFAAAFAALYASHMLGDHVLGQTDWQAAHKADRTVAGWAALAGHVAGYGIVQAVALWSLVAAGVPLGADAILAGLGFSVVTHAFIDRRWPVLWLLRHTGSAPFAELNSGGINGPYLADQSLHVACLFVAALLVGGLS